MSALQAVEVEDLRVVRGDQEVLPGVSFSVGRGSVTGLLGPSGCGKSTLLRAIVGVQIVAGGAVTVLGAAAGSPDLRTRIGYSTQAPALYADLTVGQNLEYFAVVLGAPADDADRCIEEVGLVAHRDQLVSRLSGGQLSRANLAVALLGAPDLLVLDEPTVGLDPVLREELWVLFHRISRERGVTLIVSSHVMDEAARCQRLVLMRDGRILADDTPDALRRRTGTDDLEQAFLRLVRSGDGEGRPVVAAGEPDRTPAGAGRHVERPRPATRRAAVLLGLLALVGAAIAAYASIADARGSISTDNAQIDGNEIAVVAPATGTLVDWQGAVGTTFQRRQVLGRIKIQDGFVQPQMSLRAPAAGTVARDDAVPGDYVTQGATLATAYDLSDVFVTARVQEGDVAAVQPGQAVDISVDAYPGRRLNGRVEEVEGASAATFSGQPQNSSWGSYQKVTQDVPVKVRIDDSKGLYLVPGMSVTARIHRSRDA